MFFTESKVIFNPKTWPCGCQGKMCIIIIIIIIVNIFGAIVYCSFWIAKYILHPKVSVIFTSQSRNISVWKKNVFGMRSLKELEYDI